MDKIDKKGKQWCAAPGCMSLVTEKRHFFRFPKEHSRYIVLIIIYKKYIN